MLRWREFCLLLCCVHSASACDASAAIESCAVGARCPCPSGVPGRQTCDADGRDLLCLCDGAQGQGGTGGLGMGTGAVGGPSQGTGGVTSGSGGVMASPSGPAVAVADPQDEAATVWDQTQLKTYEIQVSDANLNTLDSAPAREQYVAATFLHGGQAYPVGLRYKGSVGAFLGCVSGGLGGGITDGYKTCAKLSMKVSFNWNNDGGRFLGLKKLLFHSMNNDQSMLRERLGYFLFRQMGVAAPRAVHARLMINGSFAGLFAVVEHVDSRFTRAHFTDGGDGNLYKEIWPKWTGAGDYLPALETNESDPAVSFDRVVRFASEIGQASGPDNIFAVVSRWMDPRYVMRAIAVDRTIVNDDGMFHWYCGGSIIGNVNTGNNPGPCSNHNYYWYEEQDADRLWFVPWDLDLAFEGETTGFTNILTPWDQSDPSCLVNGAPGLAGSPNQLPPSCDPMTHSWGRQSQLYRDAVRELLAGPYSPAVVDAQMSAWKAQIAGAVEEQRARFGYSEQVPSTNRWGDEVSRLESFVSSRRAAMQQLAN